MIKRATLLLLGLDFVVFFYYVVGNAQRFLVDTQIMLLRVVSVLSAAAFLSALAGLVAAIVFRTRGVRRFFPSALIGWAACMVAAVTLAFFSSSVQAFAAGL